MLASFAQRLAAWCLRHSGKPGDYEVIAYGMECKIADLLQLTALAVIGILLRKPLETLSCCVCFSILKKQVGGYHAPNHLWCIVSFTSFVAGAVLIAGAVPNRAALPAGMCLCVLTVAAVLCIPPIAHSNHPKTEQAARESHLKGKRIALLQAVAILAAAVLFPLQSFWLAGACGGFAAALTLYIAHGREGTG